MELITVEMHVGLQTLSKKPKHLNPHIPPRAFCFTILLFCAQGQKHPQPTSSELNEETVTKYLTHARLALSHAHLNTRCLSCTQAV